MYKHFVRVVDGIVVHRFSSAFEEPEDGDICVNEDGSRHYNEPAINERGQYIYRWENGEEVERSREELELEWSNRPAPPLTEIQQIRLEQAQANAELFEMMLMLTGGGM